MLVTNIHDEKGCRQAAKLSDTTQHFFHFIFITAQSETFFLGKVFCSTAFIQHFINALHFLNAFTNRVEVGKHTTQPTLGSKRHVYAVSAFAYDFFSLLFGSYKHDFLTALRNLLHSGGSFLQVIYSFI